MPKKKKRAKIKNKKKNIQKSPGSTLFFICSILDDKSSNIARAAVVERRFCFQNDNASFIFINKQLYQLPEVSIPNMFGATLSSLTYKENEN